ncbi:MAG: hypothetical protein ACREOZ_02695, partial [Gloeomargaritales cyanobacterium]
EFREGAKDLEWVLPEELYHQFGSLLGSSAKKNWTTVLQADPGIARDTVEQFWEDVNLFKLGYMSNDALKLHRKYLMNVRKPREMTVSEFSQRIDYLHALIAEFPNVQARHTFNDDDIKEFIFEAMPDTWQVHFTRAGKEISELDKSEVIQYFRSQEALSDKQAEKNIIPSPEIINRIITIAVAVVKNIKRKATIIQIIPRSPHKAKAGVQIKILRVLFMSEVGIRGVNASLILKEATKKKKIQNNLTRRRRSARASPKAIRTKAMPIVKIHQMKKYFASIVQPIKKNPIYSTIRQSLS